MSEWVDRIRNHAVWQTFDEFGRYLHDANVKAESTSDASAIAALNRLRVVHEIISARLRKVDPLHTYVSPFDGVNTAFRSAIGEIQAYIADGNVGHLVAANVQIDSAIAHFGGFHVPQTKEDVAAIQKASADYRETVEKYLSEIKEVVSIRTAELKSLGEKFEQFFATTKDELAKIGKLSAESTDQVISKAAGLEAELTALKGKIDAASAQLASITADFQAQFAAGQEARTREHLEAQTARQEKFTGTSAEQQTQFVAAQAERQEKANAVAAEQQSQFLAAQNERQEKYNALSAEHIQKLTEQNDQFTRARDETIKKNSELLADLDRQYKAAAQNILDKINEHKAQVENLVGVIGNLGVTSGYLKAANHARWSLWFWQTITVGALAGLIAVAYRAFADPSTPFSWETFAGRALLSLTVGVLAAYAANQADKFLHSERRNRQLALELEAIGPYLAPLPPEMQNDFRVKLGERSFGQSGGTTITPADKSPATVVDVIDTVSKSKELKELVTEILKAKEKTGG